MKTSFRSKTSYRSIYFSFKHFLFPHFRSFSNSCKNSLVLDMQIKRNFKQIEYNENGTSFTLSNTHLDFVLSFARQNENLSVCQLIIMKLIFSFSFFSPEKKKIILHLKSVFFVHHHSNVGLHQSPTRFLFLHFTGIPGKNPFRLITASY